jgi:hypothetical protein
MTKATQQDKAIEPNKPRKLVNQLDLENRVD